MEINHEIGMLYLYFHPAFIVVTTVILINSIFPLQAWLVFA